MYREKDPVIQQSDYAPRQGYYDQFKRLETTGPYQEYFFIN